MADELEFGVADLLLEVEAMKKLAGALIAKDSIPRFDEMQANLRTLRANAVLTWSVPPTRPLETVPSAGEYELKAGGSHAVVGRVSFVWHLRGGKPPLRTAFLCGNASTRIELVDLETDASLGMWRMEVGAGDSPGCCFHAQILGETAEVPFPSTLPIPRIPTIAPTPMAAFELLLGELFQTRWREVVARGYGPSTVWRGVQQRRWQALLGWQQDVIGKAGTSPLMALKAFPPASIFA